SKSFLARRVLGLSILPLAALFAQSDTAQVSGYVKDATGATVPGAAVVIRNESTGIERHVLTNNAGYYVVTSVPAGIYSVSVEAPGFKSAQRTQNRIDPNIAATSDMTLGVGALSEKIEVIASTARLQSDTAALGEVVDREQIQNIQLNGRNPLFLAQLKPGVRGGT